MRAALFGGGRGGARLLVCDGDSITSSPVSPPPQAWPDYAAALLGPRYSVLNIAVSGSRVAHLDGALAGDTPVWDRVYVLGLGLNNVRDGETAADLQAYLRAQVAAARALGFPRCVLVGEYSNYLVDQSPNPAAMAALDATIDAMIGGDHLGADIAVDWRPVVSVADLANTELFENGHPLEVCNRTILAPKFVADVGPVL